MSSSGSVLQTALAHCMFLAEITFLLSVPDFQAVNNGVVFTVWVFGLGELFEPSEASEFSFPFVGYCGTYTS